VRRDHALRKCVVTTRLSQVVVTTHPSRHGALEAHETEGPFQLMKGTCCRPPIINSTINQRCMVMYFPLQAFASGPARMERQVWATGVWHAALQTFWRYVGGHRGWGILKTRSVKSGQLESVTHFSVILTRHTKLRSCITVGSVVLHPLLCKRAQVVRDQRSHGAGEHEADACRQQVLCASTDTRENVSRAFKIRK
jgi:hypothetical protein